MIAPIGPEYRNLEIKIFHSQLLSTINIFVPWRLSKKFNIVLLNSVRHIDVMALQQEITSHLLYSWYLFTLVARTDPDILCAVISVRTRQFSVDRLSDHILWSNCLFKTENHIENHIETEKPLIWGLRNMWVLYMN